MADQGTNDGRPAATTSSPGSHRRSVPEQKTHYVTYTIAALAILAVSSRVHARRARSRLAHYSNSSIQANAKAKAWKEAYMREKAENARLSLLHRPKVSREANNDAVRKDGWNKSVEERESEVTTWLRQQGSKRDGRAAASIATAESISPAVLDSSTHLPKGELSSAAVIPESQLYTSEVVPPVTVGGGIAEHETEGTLPDKAIATKPELKSATHPPVSQTPITSLSSNLARAPSTASTFPRIDSKMQRSHPLLRDASSPALTVSNATFAHLRGSNSIQSGDSHISAASVSPSDSADEAVELRRKICELEDQVGLMRVWADEQCRKLGLPSGHFEHRARP